MTAVQTAHVGNLLKKLGNQSLVLAGDFNIPRGNANYQKMVARYHDNVPPGVVTTIDWDLHKAKGEGKPKIEVVVDYIWSTPSYLVKDVRVVSGVSDHCD